jgi:hypothetical protein
MARKLATSTSTIAKSSHFSRMTSPWKILFNCGSLSLVTDFYRKHYLPWKQAEFFSYPPGRPEHNLTGRAGI